MSFDFESAYQLTTSDGEVKEISQNGTTVWERAVSTPAPQNTNFAPTRSGNALGVAITGNSVQGSLPAGYTQLEYIQSSGTQYIDTGISPAGKKIGAVIDFQFTSTSRNSGGVFGSNKTDGTDNCQFTVHSSKWRIKLNSYAGYGTNYDTNRHTARCNMPDGTSLDSTVYTTTQYTVESSNNCNVYVGACHYEVSTSTDIYSLVGKLYSAKVYDDTTLVRDFIPAKNSSNVLGMYDLVSGQFFTNAGTGSFTAGAEVKPTPTNPIEVKGVGERELPVGYTQLEYIHSQPVSEGIAYIDTLFIPTKNSKARVKFCPVATNGSSFFGARKDDESARFSATTFSRGTTFAFAMTNSTWSSNRTTVTVGNIYDCIAYNGKQIINGTEYTEPTVSNFSTTSTFKLAPVDGNGLATSAEGASTKYYLCQLWENDILVHDFIPAKNSSNEVGMYDLVSKTFFTNAGTDSFTAGPEVASCKLPITVGSTTYNLAIASPLQKVGTYADVLNSNGTITRNVGVKVFDGTENFVSEGILDGCWAYSTRLDSDTTFTDMTVLCTHFKNSSTLPSTADRQGYALLGKVSQGTQAKPVGKYVGFGATVDYPTLAEWQAFLAAQYAAGTPVTIYYPLATPTTETFTQPTIPLTKGTTYQWELDTEITPTTSSLNYLGKEGA